MPKPTRSSIHLAFSYASCPFVCFLFSFITHKTYKTLPMNCIIDKYSICKTWFAKTFWDPGLLFDSWCPSGIDCILASPTMHLFILPILDVMKIRSILRYKNEPIPKKIILQATATQKLSQLAHSCPVHAVARLI